MAQGYAGDQLARRALAKGLKHLPPSPGMNAREVELWNMVVQDFPVAYFRESDRPLIEAYIHTKVELDEENRLLAEEGRIIEGYHGRNIENPRSKISQSLHRVLLSQAKALRLSPLSRLVGNQMPGDSEHRRAEVDTMADTSAENSGGIRLVK